MTFFWYFTIFWETKPGMSIYIDQKYVKAMGGLGLKNQVGLFYREFYAEFAGFYQNQKF